MSKVLEAECAAEVVTVGGLPVASDILSEGVGASEGLVIIQGDRVYYLTSNASDIKTSLDKLTEAITKITQTLTAIGAGMTGSTTAPPGSLATNVSAINALVAQLVTLKGSLK